MSARVVIIGAGTAGTRLAQLLDTRYDVTVLGDEPSYDRSRLTEYIAGRATEPVVGKGKLATASRSSGEGRHSGTGRAGCL